jgi:hypothetical protein
VSPSLRRGGSWLVEELIAAGAGGSSKYGRQDKRKMVRAAREVLTSKSRRFSVWTIACETASLWFL